MSNTKFCVLVPSVFCRFKVFPTSIDAYYNTGCRLVYPHLCISACCLSVLRNRTQYYHTDGICRRLQKNGTNFYCTRSDEKKELFIKHKDRVKSEFKSYIEQNKERLRDTELKIKHTGSVLLKDIKETRDKVKEKVEEVVEVGIGTGYQNGTPFTMTCYFREKIFIQYQIFCVFHEYYCHHTSEC